MILSSFRAHVLWQREEAISFSYINKEIKYEGSENEWPGCYPMEDHRWFNDVANHSALFKPYFTNYSARTKPYLAAAHTVVAFRQALYSYYYLTPNRQGRDMNRCAKSWVSHTN